MKKYILGFEINSTPLYIYSVHLLEQDFHTFNNKKQKTNLLEQREINPNN